jgi:hypothetical protein
MNATATLTRVVLGSIDEAALELAIVTELKSRYTQDEIATQLQRAAELLGVGSPDEAIALEVTREELAALKTAREVLARL